MVELIVLIIFVLSLGVVVFIGAKKMPILVQLPEVNEGVQKENIVVVLKRKIKPHIPDKIILLKALSKIRVLVLKVEKNIDYWLQKMRKKIHIQKQEEEKKKNGNGNSQTPPTMPE